MKSNVPKEKVNDNKRCTTFYDLAFKVKSTFYNNKCSVLYNVAITH